MTIVSWEFESPSLHVLISFLYEYHLQRCDWCCQRVEPIVGVFLFFPLPAWGGCVLGAGIFYSEKFRI